MKFTEEELKLYAAPLSETENQKCLNAIEMVRDALKCLGFTDEGKQIRKLYEDTYAYSLDMKSDAGTRKIRLFVQGSYANNTNVRSQSDVDIAVVQEDVFNTKYRSSSSAYPQSDSNYHFCDAKSTARSFKDEVQQCLQEKFASDVERKNKSIKVHGNTYRKDVDSVPCRRYRDYRNDFRNDVDNYVGGIVITPDQGDRIINYPEQHIANGKQKNTETNFYYKKMVRIMKNMRFLMDDQGCSYDSKVSSFGLESLLWNVPNDIFVRHSSYKFIFDEIVSYLHNHREDISTYKEANGIKVLCQNSDMVDAYKIFLDELYIFYEWE